MTTDREDATPPDELPASALAEIVDLLRTFHDEPGHRREVAQQAAILWWKLDGTGLCGTTPPEAWEEALLGLAAGHTGDDRLRRQCATETEVEELMLRLGGS